PLPISLTIYAVTNAFERRDRRGAAPHRLAVGAERGDLAGTAGELGDQSDLDALRLHGRDEQVPRRVWRHVEQTEPFEYRSPHATPAILIEQRSAARGARQRPGLQA